MRPVISAIWRILRPLVFSFVKYVVRSFEPDAPNYTPRISGLLTFENGDFTYEMSILKSLDAGEMRAWLDSFDGVALGSDAFFPFFDNIERARRSGVKYIAQPGGSIRDDLVIDCCNKYNMVMAFTHMRLFHH